MVTNNALKRQTSLLSIASNTTLVILKLVVGLSVGAVSLVSEAMHSGVDLIASFIAFWAVRKATTPPDHEHDYGHGKFENLSAAVEALLIVGAAVGIVYEALMKSNNTEIPGGLIYGIVIMAISIVINLAVSSRLLSVAKKTNSQALEADGLHLRSDIWTSVGVLTGLVVMQVMHWAWIDSVISLFIAGIIFRAGWRMIVNSTMELTDASLPQVEENEIRDIILSMPEVVSMHCLRTRKSGSYPLLDVHVVFDGNMALSRVHAVCDEIEEKIHAQLGPFDVTIHPEPVGSAPTSKAERYEEDADVPAQSEVA